MLIVRRIILHLESMYKNGQMEDKGDTLLTHQGYGIPSIGNSPKQENFRGKTHRKKRVCIQMYFQVMCTYLMLETVFIHS